MAALSDAERQAIDLEVMDAMEQFKPFGATAEQVWTVLHLAGAYWNVFAVRSSLVRLARTGAVERSIGADGLRGWRTAAW